MLKEFFLVDYNSINSFKEISEPLLDMATSSFLLIAAIFELFKGFIGKSNVESRVTIFILAAISMTAFNQYNQKVLDLSFATSDKILAKLHITSMTKISDIMKSTPADQIQKNDQNIKDNTKTKNKVADATNILGEARIFIANNLAIAVAWLVSVIAIGLSRILFTVIYYSLVVLAPIVIFISVFPGYEGSLKAFWQAFIWCFLAPIVFSVTFVLMHLVAQKEDPSLVGGLESLINVLLYGIFLVGSFIMTYKISTSQPLTGFAEKASMVGAMAMAAPFTSVSSFAQSAIHSPLQTYANSKHSLHKMKGGIEKISKNHTPHSGIGDISKMNHAEIGKKFGDKTATQLYSHQSLNDYMGNKYGLSNTGINPNPPTTASIAATSPSSKTYSNPVLDNRKFEIDPNTMSSREISPSSDYIGNRFGLPHTINTNISPGQNALQSKNTLNTDSKLKHVSNSLKTNLEGEVSKSIDSKPSTLPKQVRVPEVANTRPVTESHTKLKSKPGAKGNLNGNI